MKMKRRKPSAAMLSCEMQLWAPLGKRKMAASGEEDKGLVCHMATNELILMVVSMSTKIKYS